MRICTSQQGQSLIEILFAIALFTVGVVTVGYVLFDAFDSLRYGTEATQARLFAQEGIEAVRALKDADGDHLQDGVFGLSEEMGVWSLDGEVDTYGGFTRTITLLETESETWSVISKVVWEDPGGQAKEYAIETLLTNWDQTRGDAGELGFDVASVSLNASSTHIDGITLYNAGSGDVLVLDGLALSFEGGGLIEEVYLNDSILFSHASSSAVPSGEYIDITDHMIEYASGVHAIGPIIVSSPLTANSHLILSLQFTDGSYRHIRMIP